MDKVVCRRGKFMKKMTGVLALAMALTPICNMSASAQTTTAITDNGLYAVTVTLDPKDVEGIEVTGVGIKGEFLFYESNMTGHTDETGMLDGVEKYYTPSEYKDGMASIGGLYYEDMTLNEDGVYEVTLNLPAGVYPYQFVINPELGPESEWMTWANVITKTGEKGCFGFGDEEKNKSIPDPKNPPMNVTLTGTQSNSELIVGETARTPVDDPAQRGTVSFQSYTDLNGQVQTLGVYLPAGYDKTQSYPLIVLSHGRFGNEADWFSQGQLNNIMDNLIAEGKTRPAIVVTPNGNVFQEEEYWNFEQYGKNIRECVLPYIESIYNVSTDLNDRCFSGLSMGGMTTMHMFYNCTDLFGYYGAFSGAITPAMSSYNPDNPAIHNVKLFIGAGEEDYAYDGKEFAVKTAMEALDELGVKYDSYFLTGAHDWFNWPEIFEYYVANVLWK